MRRLMAWLSVASLLTLPFPASSAEAATSGLAASAIGWQRREAGSCLCKGSCLGVTSISALISHPELG